MKGILVCSRARVWVAIAVLASIFGACASSGKIQEDDRRTQNVTDRGKDTSPKAKVLASLRGSKLKKGAIQNYRFLVPSPMLYVSNNYNYGGKDPKPISVLTAEYEFPEERRWPPSNRNALLEADFSLMNSGSDERYFNFNEKFDVWLDADAFRRGAQRKFVSLEKLKNEKFDAVLLETHYRYVNETTKDNRRAVWAISAAVRPNLSLFPKESAEIKAKYGVSTFTPRALGITLTLHGTQFGDVESEIPMAKEIFRQIVSSVTPDEDEIGVMETEK